MSFNKDNNEVIRYFNNLSKKMNNFETFDKNLGEGLISKGTELSKTNKEARIKGRIDSMMRKETFDESSTPVEELKTITDDTIKELVKREMDNIFGK